MPPRPVFFILLFLICCFVRTSYAFKVNSQGASVIQGCFSQCSEPSQVPCGESITSNCYDEGIVDDCVCEGSGTGLNVKQCFKNSLSLFRKPLSCGDTITDDCGNSCGVTRDDFLCKKSNYESCEEAVSNFGEGFYNIQGTRLYCGADGYALFARVPGGQSKFFYPGLSLNEAQLPSNEPSETLSQISLTPSNSPSGDEVVYGHVNMSVAQSIKSTRFKCRLNAGAAFTTYETTVLTEWTPAAYPNYNTGGEWAIVSIPPHSRHSHYVCGAFQSSASDGIHGIGYCFEAGAGDSFANHRASFNHFPNKLTVISCSGGGSKRTDAEFQLWVKF